LKGTLLKKRESFLKRIKEGISKEETQEACLLRGIATSRKGPGWQTFEERKKNKGGTFMPLVTRRIFPCVLTVRNVGRGGK